ncbi:MAG: hypothetical protein ABS901_05590 [Candidatus Limivicinus sp.]|jgi:hypothetical protein
MKKVFTTLAFVLVFVLSVTMISACADQAPASAESAAPVQQVTVPTPPPATPAATVPATVPAVPETAAVPAASTTEPAPAAEQKEVDQIVGTFKYPDPPYECDFDKYIVFKEDGGFMYVTNLYGAGGSVSQTIQTNEDFYWVKTGSNSYELHEDYHDINGEFVSYFTYSAEDDAIYMFGSLYASRDNSLVMN